MQGVPPQRSTAGRPPHYGRGDAHLQCCPFPEEREKTAAPAAAVLRLRNAASTLSCCDSHWLGWNLGLKGSPRRIVQWVLLSREKSEETRGGGGWSTIAVGTH